MEKPQYYDPRKEKLQRIHEINLKEAEKAGLTIEEWHQKMSEIGNAPLVTTIQELTYEQIIINSAREIGRQNRKKSRGWLNWS